MTTFSHYKGATLQWLVTWSDGDPFFEDTRFSATLKFPGALKIDLSCEVLDERTLRVTASPSEQSSWPVTTRGVVRITRRELAAGPGAEDFIHPPVDVYLEVLP